MLGLNPLLLGIGIIMNVVPVFAVITALTACSCLVIRHNRLEKEYIDKHKLIIDDLKDIDYEDVIKTEYEVVLELEQLESFEIDLLTGNLDDSFTV